MRGDGRRGGVAGKPFDYDGYGQLTDRLGRAFGRLGLNRVLVPAAPPDLRAYLSSQKPGDDAAATGEPEIAASDETLSVSRPS
jgi:hypothetical protein